MNARRTAIAATILLLGVVPAAATGAQPNEPQVDENERLQASKQGFATALVLASRQLDDAFAAAIRSAADDPQLDQSLTDQRRAFSADKLLPQSPRMYRARREYFDARTNAFETLKRVYDTRILIARQELDEARLKRLTDEWRDMERAERETIERIRNLSDPSEQRGAKGRLNSFEIQALIDCLDERIAIVLAKSTSAQRDAAYQKLLADLDDSLRSRTLSLRFPIRDVARDEEGTINVTLGPPAELDGLARAHRPIQGFRRLSLSVEKLLEIESGDDLVLSGVPRFTMTAPVEAARVLSVVQFDSELSGHGYHLVLQNLKYKLLPPQAIDAATARQ